MVQLGTKNPRERPRKVDRQSGLNRRKIPAMRVFPALGLLVLLAACSGDPRSYGITGPGSGPDGRSRDRCA